uniref:Uncharacterized protein n=1 Tax=Phenylobacterium glaciei TaxID=2803784 RepID=A0A974P4J5_9CAUL|nr:hypothetical protein JKL49_06040 [Phenylobacterium glaciei]
MTTPDAPPVRKSVLRRIETRALLIWLACAAAIWGSSTSPARWWRATPRRWISTCC